jgi:dipeptidyl-peptidase-4
MSPSNAPAPPTSDDYARAERFLMWNKERYVLNADIEPRWIGKQDRFWYLRTNNAGQKEFILVEAETGRSGPAFDHQALAAALSQALEKTIEPGDLPFTSFRYAQGKTAIEFLIDDTLWTYSLGAGNGLSARPFDRSPGASLSPDGKWAAFVRDHNVWIRPTSGDAAFALTTDGIEHHGYAGYPGICCHPVSDIRSGVSRQPQVLWSPDSRYLLSHRIDERNVEDFHLIQSVPEDGSVRPKMYSFRYSLPGDKHVPMLEPVVFDVAARQQIPLRIEPMVCCWWTLIQKRMTWWSPDSRAFYFIHRNRAFTAMSLHKADLPVGSVREVLRETGDNLDEGLDTWHIGDLMRTLSNGDVLWCSLRDGWGHLYYYSSTGQLLHQITQGEWTVRAILRVDETNKRLFFTASGGEPGRDPYEQRLYRIQLDGTGLKLLTPEEADHPLVPEWGMSAEDPLSTPAERSRLSASGRYFVDSYSRPDVPPVLVLRDCDGRLIRELERADISRLRAAGYTPIEPFQVLAADGTTPIYGNLHRPSNFDPTKKYPIIDACYPSVMSLRAGKSFSAAVFDLEEAQCIAELGFIVVTLDGRGTPRRSRAFRSYARGRMDKIDEPEDHIAGIRQLAQRYPYMDLNRVGIFGESAGGGRATHSLFKYPDFYKVGVANCGSHEQLATLHPWGETYIGSPEAGNYASASSLPLAANLRGKLLLAHGELDENASPIQAMKLVDALIKANKDFDLLILPNDNHGTACRSPYFIRRKWDFLVRHLLGMEPPAGYAIVRPYDKSRIRRPS